LRLSPASIVILRVSKPNCLGGRLAPETDDIEDRARLAVAGQSPLAIVEQTSTHWGGPPFR
jgi:hypothetical protein